ncbi:hypothetical protein [Streptomyces sp. NPDC005244]|uniref:hypothetical protein n=1 Tax=Streptomyces sp. NPDC005244 TaxID=3364708 RepID=UPI00368606EB
MPNQATIEEDVSAPKLSPASTYWAISPTASAPLTWSPASEWTTLSTDPLFVEKACDVVGLYPSPPDGAVVLSVDGKSQIQALDRSQPSSADARHARTPHS